MVSMDDSTGEILAARFFPFEGSHGYLWLLNRVVKDYGIPLSVYQDRHGSLKRNDSNWSIEEGSRADNCLRRSGRHWRHWAYDLSSPYLRKPRAAWKGSSGRCRTGLWPRCVSTALITWTRATDSSTRPLSKGSTGVSP